MKAIDRLTQSWIRNASDRKAAQNGCRFDAKRGAYTVFWIERYCRLYEGEMAGQPMILRGCAQCKRNGTSASLTEGSWDDDAIKFSLRRAERHAACIAAGHPFDWQYDNVMRLFSWVRWSDRWKRWVRRFTDASIWVAKKNKKSPTLAAIGLYLTCGDGEQGQHVFLAAKDGNQAREVAGKHVIEMLLKSEELKAECTINQTTKQVTHEPTRSTLRPLSSSNSRTQEAKEGLNGSVLIDETHVVDREFVNRLTRAGISRSEPMHLEVSTAGNNPDSYGRERFDYALQVESGEREDQSLFVAIYAAPQNVTDAELEADPLKYGRMANPAFGHTVDPQEFLADHAKSKASLAKLALWKMYRCNLWQATDNPWLDMSAWKRCERKYVEADLVGRECYAALDLSKVLDTSALDLMFPEDGGGLRQLAYHWLPEDTAHNQNHLAPFLEWAREGWLKLTPGNVVDYAFIRKTLNEIHGKFHLLKLAYDHTYAEQLIQRLIEEDGWDREIFVPFPQTIMQFARPTAAYERLITEGKLWHNGNRLLTWQARNTRVKSDPNQNIRPVKPKYGNHLTIDGIVAGIMALHEATVVRVDEEAWYSAGTLRD